MTAVAGFVHKGKVWIGADSAATDEGSGLAIRADRKVFRNGKFLFGFTNSFRMGQLLRYAFTPPRSKSGQELDAYMVTDFVNALRTCLKDGGYARKKDDAESLDESCFLVGFRSRLFKIDCDYQVAESLDGYDACGSAEDVLLGSLHSTKRMDPALRLRLALGAAERHNSKVRRPFHIESL